MCLGQPALPALRVQPALLHLLQAPPGLQGCAVVSALPGARPAPLALKEASVFPASPALLVTLELKAPSVLKVQSAPRDPLDLPERREPALLARPAPLVAERPDLQERLVRVEAQPDQRVQLDLRVDRLVPPARLAPTALRALPGPLLLAPPGLPAHKALWELKALLALLDRADRLVLKVFLDLRGLVAVQSARRGLLARHLALPVLRVRLVLPAQRDSQAQLAVKVLWGPRVLPVQPAPLGLRAQRGREAPDLPVLSALPADPQVPRELPAPLVDLKVSPAPLGLLAQREHQSLVLPALEEL